MVLAVFLVVPQSPTERAQTQVAVFQGVQQNIGPFPLSTVYFESDIDIDDLSPFSRERVESTINASDLPEALSIIDRLQNELD